MTPEVSASSAVLAANQGLYNGFLAAGLVWALVTGRRDLKIFFLGCVVVAGIFGGVTAKTSILFTQALPALVLGASSIVRLDRKRAPWRAADAPDRPSTPRSAGRPCCRWRQAPRGMTPPSRRLPT